MILDNKKGFTLLEVILAITISAVIVIGLMTSFWRGVGVWKKTKGMITLTSDFRFFVDVLDSDLENAVKIPETLLVKSFFVEEDGKSIIFFVLKRLKDNKVAHIYKTQYKLSKSTENAEEDMFILNRASKEIKKTEDVNYEFKSADFRVISSNLQGPDLKFSGSIFKEGLSICEKADAGQTEVDKHLGTIKLTKDIRRGEKTIVFPCRTVHICYQK